MPNPGQRFRGSGRSSRVPPPCRESFTLKSHTLERFSLKSRTLASAKHQRTGDYIVYVAFGTLPPSYLTLQSDMFHTHPYTLGPPYVDSCALFVGALNSQITALMIGCISLYPARPTGPSVKIPFLGQNLPAWATQQTSNGLVVELLRHSGCAPLVPAE